MATFSYISAKKKLLALILLLLTYLVLFNYYFPLAENLFYAKLKYLNENVRETLFMIGNESEQYYSLIDGVKYPTYLTLSRNKSINFDYLNRNSAMKKILYWNKYFHYTGYRYGFGKTQPFINMNCPVTNCEASEEKNRLAEMDMVIFHGSSDPFSIPKKRSESQQWLFLNYESPMLTPNFGIIENVYNLTSTYKSDSDFPGFYEYEAGFEWKENTTFDANFDRLRDKTEFAAALISNCNDQSNRLKILSNLQKFIPIKIFGRCGEKCPEKFKNGQNETCLDIVCKEFKFYFAIENAVCADYITEKFFKVFKYDIIPVVYGGGIYEKHVPKSGYINMNDFKTPELLADYLKYLSNNKTAFNSYFKWKRHISFSTSLSTTTLCDICIHLHLQHFTGVKRKTFKNLKSYWSIQNNCKKIRKN